MGRSFKQRKLKKVRRFKVKSIKPAESTAKKNKRTMKTWEYFLLGGALLLAIGFIVFAARTAMLFRIPNRHRLPCKQPNRLIPGGNFADLYQ